MKKRKNRRGFSLMRAFEEATEGPLDVTSAFVAGAITWSLVLVSTGILNLVWGYGANFLQLMAGLYPGYDPASPLGLFPLTLYSLADGGLCVGLAVLIYNKVSK